MSDKPQAATGPLFALPDHAIVRIAGRDALAFAQAQFMNDISALGDHQWHWNGWLTPKGRVLALFALIRIDAETLWLVLPDADAASFIEALGRYVFRSKVVLDVPDDLSVSGGFDPPAEAAGNRCAELADGNLELDMGGEGGPRRLCIGTTPSPADPQADPHAEARWRQADLAHGLPRLDASQVEQWTPQQLSLERLKAFSVKKGCYPGQEIVARTHYLGKIKRGLARLQAAHALAVGMAIRQDERDVGSIVTLVPDGHEALAVLPLDLGGTPLRAGGGDVERLPLLEGLAR